MNAIRVCLVGFVALSGCGPRSQTEDEGAGVVGGIDTSKEGLTSFSRDKGYAAWRAEPEIHDTRAPHGKKVRVFFNDTLAASLEAGNAEHPVGSATAKELYDGDGRISGHAVMVKVAEGGKDSWLYFEGFTPDYADPFYGRAHPTCAGCHASGADFIRSPLP